MNSNSKKLEKKDRQKSAIITFFSCLILFLVIYFYQFTKEIPVPEKAVTTMLINFGDNQNGSQVEEPQVQETPPTPPLPTPIVKKEKTSPPKEKIITGKENIPAIAPKKENHPPKKNEKIEKKIKETPKKIEKKITPSPQKKNTPSPEKKQEKTPTEDPKAQQALGNLIKGRGNKNASQGNSQSSGNSGDPLGGEGNGESKIGVDRKLISFIPGTMGRGGAQPQHQCSGAGNIIIQYTVDKQGNILTAKRLSGSNDPCIINTAVGWVKKYVRAEKAPSLSSGTYTISF